MAPAATGLARVLEGTSGLSEAVQALSVNWQAGVASNNAYIAAIQAGATDAEAAAARTAAYNAEVAALTSGWVSGGGAMIATSTELNDIEQQRIATMNTAAQSSQIVSDALAEEIQKKIESQMAGAALADTQARLEADSRLAAQGLLGAGDQAAILAAKYGIAADAARFLIQQQQALANKAAMAEQRAGERNPGTSGAAEAAAQEEARLQTIYRRLANAGQAAGAGRVATAGGTGRALVSTEQDTQGKSSKDCPRLARAHRRNRQAHRRRARAAMRKLQNDMAQSSADRRAGNEADDLDLVGVKDPKEAARLNDRERAQAAARQRDQQARDEANANMAAGNAETAQKIYDARQDQISKQQALDESYYARQRELAGDPAALEALQQQYDEATRAISEATDQRIAFAQAEAEQKKQAVEDEKAAVIAAAQAQADAVIAAAERSAGSVKGSIASAKMSAVADLQAIGSAVNAIPSSKTVTVTVTSNASGVPAPGRRAAPMGHTRAAVRS